MNFTLNDREVNFDLDSRVIDFTLNNGVVNFKLNATQEETPGDAGCLRLLETGFYRLLESGGFRELEDCPDVIGTDNTLDATLDFTI